MRSDLALAALACAAVPGMTPVSVSGIGPTGDELDDLEVQRALVEDATGRSWVVHAPRNPVAGARLQRNEELVRQLSRHVPYKVPAAAGYAAVGKDGYAVVYPYVEGSSLDFGRLPAGPGLASAVGRAIAAVHNIPRGVFEEQDVPVFDAAGYRKRLIAVVDRAAETGRVPTGLLARWEEAFDAAPLWQFATTPVHGSMRGSSVLVAFTDEQDASSGRVVAVLNWEDASVADPATDLAGLSAQTTPQAWEAILDSYSLARTQRPDPYLHARARLIAETRALRGLAQSVADGAEESVRKSVEALRRMDRLTEDDDSLVPGTARIRAGMPTDATTVVGRDPDVEEDQGDSAGPDTPTAADPDSAFASSDNTGDWDDEGVADEGVDLGDAPQDDDVRDNPSDEGHTDGAVDDVSPSSTLPYRERADQADPGPGFGFEEDEIWLNGDVDKPEVRAETDDGGPLPDRHLDPDPTIEVPVVQSHRDLEAVGEKHPVRPDDEASTEVEDLDDDERLHELYGMPELTSEHQHVAPTAADDEGVVQPGGPDEDQSERA